MGLNWFQTFSSFKDRFAPSEGVAAQAIKTNHEHLSHNNHFNNNAHYHANNHYQNHASTYTDSSNSNNLYSFPPNNINYPSQNQDTNGGNHAKPMGTVNSYSPPPSGPLKSISHQQLDTSNGYVNNPYHYKAPTENGYLPPNGDDKDESANGADAEYNKAEDDSVGVLPASTMDHTADNMPADDVGNLMVDNDMSYEDMTADMDSMNDAKSNNNHHSYEAGKEYPTPPPDWLEKYPESTKHDHQGHHQGKKPDIVFDHSQDHHHQPDIILDHDDHQHYSSISSYPAYHSYPHIIYEDPHHDDHHMHVEHYEHHPTTTEPPPPPPPEPRVKKYSYFYIGRKLWYIPLYFTVWFSFYVLWLILKSIARHKVNLPNHYVARRSIMDYDVGKKQTEIVNQVAVAVLDKIEKFKRKYSI